MRIVLLEAPDKSHVSEIYSVTDISTKDIDLPGEAFFNVVSRIDALRSVNSLTMNSFMDDVGHVYSSEKEL